MKIEWCDLTDSSGDWVFVESIYDTPAYLEVEGDVWELAEEDDDASFYRHDSHPGRRIVMAIHPQKWMS